MSCRLSVLLSRSLTQGMLCVAWDAQLKILSGCLHRVFPVSTECCKPSVWWCFPVYYLQFLPFLLLDMFLIYLFKNERKVTTDASLGRNCHLLPRPLVHHTEAETLRTAQALECLWSTHAATLSFLPITRFTNLDLIKLSSIKWLPSAVREEFVFLC